MNQEERTAQKYLKALSKGNVVFEPNGNIPPDFSVGATIGVEVRRLNQNYFGQGKTRGLEEDSIPLHRKLNDVLQSYDHRFTRDSYWVALTYRRPLKGGLRNIGHAMHKALDGFLRGSRTTPSKLEVTEDIWLEIHPATAVPNRVFRHGITSDDDSGGLIEGLYTQNIIHCIQEKESKVAPYKSQFKTWWLLLVDIVLVWDLESDEVARIRSGIVNHGGFDKIIVIDYHGKACLMEID
jgi:hypothetical protein